MDTDEHDARLVHLTWADIETRCAGITAWLTEQRYQPSRVFGIPRGGIVPAAILSQMLGAPLTDHAHGPGTLIVDDVADSGETLRSLLGDDLVSPAQPFVALYAKSTTPLPFRDGAEVVDGWLEFPWERAESSTAGPEDAVRRLLQAIGDDPNREGIADTPRRVVAALREMTSGMTEDPARHLATTFAADYDEVVIVDGIRFTSLCEHHLLPFTGLAHVAYKPGENGRVVGLSKIPRVVEGFARRPQLQEQLTKQIADALEANLAPAGVAVVVRAAHSCMGCRGVRQPDARMTTSEMRGLFRDDARARAEVLALLPPPSTV